MLLSSISNIFEVVCVFEERRKVPFPGTVFSFDLLNSAQKARTTVEVFRLVFQHLSKVVAVMMSENEAASERNSHGWIDLKITFRT